MTSPLRQVTPEERLLETMRHIRDYAQTHMRPEIHGELLVIMNSADLAIEEYRQAAKVQRTANSTVIRGEIQSKGGR